MLSATDALKELKEGNSRFVSNLHHQTDSPISKRPLELSNKKRPFAIILGCSDARVPAEYIFDQGLGDLFVIRVAGNIVAPSQVGSVEFAAVHFETRLVVVLGHTQCGAIAATLAELQKPSENKSPNLYSIVSRIRPSTEPLLQTNLRNDHDKLAYTAMQANVRASTNHLRSGSVILEQLIQNDGLMIVGADYSVDTGEVNFFDLP